MSTTDSSIKITAKGIIIKIKKKNYSVRSLAARRLTKQGKFFGFEEMNSGMDNINCWS